MEHSGKNLNFWKFWPKRPRVLLPLVHSKCLKKPFGRETEDWFLLNLFNWELRLFNWWWQKRISRVRRSFASAEWLNFQSFSLNFLQKLSAKIVFLSKIHSQGFVKVKFLKKIGFPLNFECKNFAQCCPKREIRVQLFLEQKQEAVSYFGYRAKSLQSVLSKVQSNCPESFVGKIFAGLQNFFSRTVASYLTIGVVKITFQVSTGTICWEKSFL